MHKLHRGHLRLSLKKRAYNAAGSLRGLPLHPSAGPFPMDSLLNSRDGSVRLHELLLQDREYDPVTGADARQYAWEGFQHLLAKPGGSAIGDFLYQCRLRSDQCGEGIDHFKPDWFLAENVGGLRSANVRIMET